MATPSNQSVSWLARLSRAFRGKLRRTVPAQNRRALRIESLETRSLLSATVLPTISGVVYEDPTGAGVIANDTALANVTVNLWRDGGAGVFQGNNPGSTDTLVGTATTAANGSYQFPNLTAGTYFVQQDSVPGLQISSTQSVQTVKVTSADLLGTAGTMIDSFSSTPQYVSQSVHAGSTGTPSQAASEAIGGYRKLIVQLTSTGGAVSMGADSDFSGLLDYASNVASTGNYTVNWDGSNNAAQLNYTGLGGLDLTSQGASTGIELNASNDRTGGSLTLKVYTDANDWSFATITPTATSDGSLSIGGSQLVPFSTFTLGAGTGANFTDVGAIQLTISGPSTSDGEVGPIQAAGPMVLNTNFVNNVEADLSVVKTATPNPATAGNDLTYTFATSNNGPSGATGVTLSDPLPAGVQYVSSTSSQGTVSDNNGTISVSLGSLAAGASATTTVIVMVNPADTGSITNTVTVSGNQPDPNMANNTSTVTTQVSQSADLALLKTAAPNPVKAGNQLTYTLTATDNGPSNATGVTIVDTLPAGTTYVSAGGQGTATISGQTLTLNIGNLADGASATSTVVVTVASTASGTITNTATVSGNQPDPNLANNTASVSTQIDVPAHQQSIPNLTILKSVTPNPSVAHGGVLTYSLAVTNSSLTSITGGLTIDDPLPAGFRYGFEVTQYATTISNNMLVFSLPGTLAAGATETVTFEGVATAAAGSTITNQATVLDNQGDSTQSNPVITTVFGTAGSKYYLLGR